MGQWFHGRIYERRGDLSPDGKLLVYFAANWKDRSGPNSGSWTAVSRPPYLSALAIWFKGDAWNGGGLFKTNNELGHNNGGPNAFRSRDPHIPLNAFDLNLGQGEDYPIEEVRERRDGWVMIQKMNVTEPPLPSWPPLPPLEAGQTMSHETILELANWFKENPPDLSGYVTHAPAILEKACGQWRLQREERLEGFSMIRKFALLNSDIDLTATDWAEWDHRQRLVFARAGKLYAVKPNEGSAGIAELVDLNRNVFTPMEAPDWACRW